jgi:hypothetical protein
MGDWLGGASALSPSTPNWMILMGAIVVCFVWRGWDDHKNSPRGARRRRT